MDDDTRQASPDIEQRLRRLETESDRRKATRWRARLSAAVLLGAVILAIATGVGWRVSAQSGGSGPAPGVLNYQGQLTDAAGNPLNGNYDVTFRLYNVSGGGTALWTEAHAGANAVVVSSGLFSTLLGSIDPIPGEVMASSPLYLGIAVGADAEMTPRQPVSSVAYALMANDVADGAITTAKLASGAVTTDKIAPNAVSKVVYTAYWFTGEPSYSVPGDNVHHAVPLGGSFATSGGDILILGGPPLINATQCTSYVSVALDGEPLTSDNPPDMCLVSAAQAACWGFRYVPSFPAGSHTIQFVMKNDCGTTSLPTDTFIPIVVLELKR